ncbi:MAG: extracellular solute-binding protein [Eubacteriales bacterium]|nr:extracellular solute-binding protein [Eubacteriales bacterium]
MKCRAAAVLLLVCLMFSGCAWGGGTDLAPPPQARLTVFTSHEPAVYEPIIREFEARTGLWVEVEQAETAELMQRLETEKSGCDVLFGLCAEELEDADPALQEAWFPVSSRPLVLIYNPKLVRQNLPQGWAALTDDAWEGTVAFPDPASREGLLALSMAAQSGADLALLSRNLSGSLPADAAQVVDLVAEGRFYIGIALEDTALAAIDGGSDLSVTLPAEGTAALIDGALVVPGCPHPANAAQFAAFLQSRDVRRMLKTQLHRRPVWETFEALTVDPAEVLAQWQALWKEASP